MGDSDERRNDPEGFADTLSAPAHKAWLERLDGVAIGTLVDGRYRVLRRLGAGGSAMVYEAVDVELDRHVALKLVLSGEARDDDAAYRALRAEARVMARVEHRNVVGIHAIGRFEGVPYFAMELIDGPDLERWLERAGSLPLALDEAVELLAQVAAGVAAIHEAGSMHGDLKPSNILVDPTGRLVVSDLGLARTIERDKVTQTLPFAGTPAYMAPEVLRMERVPPEMMARVDVYSLAVMAYELLTGVPPFDADDLVSIMNMHATVEPTPPSRLRPELGETVDDLLLAALAKDPRLRLESVAALIDGLRAQQRRSAAASRIRVAIVDDDPDFIAFACESLEAGMPGVAISTFASGAAALEGIPAAPPDLALVDLRLPDHSGLEVLASLRGQLPRATPIAVVSAVGDARDRAVLEKLGASEYLEKPIEAHALVRAVRRMLGWGSLPPPPGSGRSWPKG